MWGYLKYELKKIWQGQVFWFILIASAVIAILGFFLACYNNAPMGDCGTTLETIYSAEKYTLLRGAGDIATLTMLCVVPIFAVILAGTSYGQEKKSHLCRCLSVAENVPLIFVPRALPLPSPGLSAVSSPSCSAVSLPSWQCRSKKWNPF